MATTKLPPCLHGMVHHWQIERASGTVSHGRCLNCKKEFDFLNDIPQFSKADIPTRAKLDKGMAKARQAYYDNQHINIW